MKELILDKSRDKLAYALNAVGVRAEMTERGLVEGKVENSWYQRSLGVIDIAEGPIRWINILKQDRRENSLHRWWVVLGIPGERSISSRQETKLKTVRKKMFPLFEKVVDMTWKGGDSGTGLVDILSREEAIVMLSQRFGNLEVKSHANGFQG